MDLFNPPPNFNYKIMNENIEIEKLDNPYVQVVWEDAAENFTQEKIKSVRHYFQKKYQTTNVNLITKTLVVDVETPNIDISFNVLDKNYQHELVKSYLESKYDNSLFEEILALDGMVDNKILLENSELTPFKKWYIKKIEFSNFLSYGNNQVLDFDKCNGITVVESDPPNFGGKTVLTVDLLLFLFFNETTKTNKAEEIFNRFTDKNNVSVKGEIIIDGEEYIIIRNIERKKSKSGDWTVKTELDFFKRLSDNSLLNFTGEQRRETETFIKESIGSKEDFLMTILTTATNLEELIDSKPTARGQVLSRFMGLDFLKRKEESGKELYSSFSKSMTSNIYNSEQLKTDNEGYLETITKNKKTVVEKQTELVDIQDRILKGKEYKESLLSSKHNDIDNELLRLQPDKVKSEIDEINEQKKSVISQISKISVVEPKEYYHEEEHDKIKEEYNLNYRKKVETLNQLKN